MAVLKLNGQTITVLLDYDRLQLGAHLSKIISLSTSLTQQIKLFIP